MAETDSHPVLGSWPSWLPYYDPHARVRGYESYFTSRIGASDNILLHLAAAYGTPWHLTFAWNQLDLFFKKKQPAGCEARRSEEAVRAARTAIANGQLYALASMLQRFMEARKAGGRDDELRTARLVTAAIRSQNPAVVKMVTEFGLQVDRLHVYISHALPSRAIQEMCETKSGIKPEMFTRSGPALAKCILGNNVSLLIQYLTKRPSSINEVRKFQEVIEEIPHLSPADIVAGERRHPLYQEQWLTAADPLDR